MFFLVKIAAWAGRVLLPLGGKGLFLAAALDSSFIPLPEGVDLWLVSLAMIQPSRMPYYVVLSTLGSLVGCCVLYLVARSGEEIYLEGHPKYSALLRVQRWVEKYESLALLVGAILPPPTPFKLVVIAAGLLKCRFDRLVIALIIGRAIRYETEGLLAVHYGPRTWRWLLRAGPRALGTVLVVILLAVLVHRLRRKPGIAIELESEGKIGNHRGETVTRG